MIARRANQDPDPADAEDDRPGDSLARTIRNYWASMGCIVSVSLVRAGNHEGHPLLVVGSDLGPTGLPRYIARDGSVAPITDREAALVNHRSYERFYLRPVRASR